MCTMSSSINILLVIIFQKIKQKIEHVWYDPKTVITTRGIRVLVLIHGNENDLGTDKIKSV